MTDYKAITLDTQIRDCGDVFSTRLRHALACEHIEKVSDLVAKRRSEVMEYKNLGKRGMQELDDFFANTDFTWEYKQPVRFTPFRLETSEGVTMTTSNGTTTISGRMTTKDICRFLDNIPSDVWQSINEGVI